MCSPTKIDLTYYEMESGSVFESGVVGVLTLAALRKETLSVYHLLGILFMFLNFKSVGLLEP